MRWSSTHIPTLRDDPAEAEAPSHRLLVRAGFIRQLMAGVYSLLPLAVRVRAKIGRIIREEMEAIGCQEFLLPALHPSELWRKSGRWDLIGDEMFRLRDRRGADIVLGFTHEEVFASLATELESYRDLPQAWFQIQTKFRDEPRPKSGVLRTREFTMKDAYTFDIDDAGLDAAFERQRGAYANIFRRLGFDAVQVEASVGIMGGTESVEFVVPADYGEDGIVRCHNCGYAANVESATSGVDQIEDSHPPAEPEKFPTPGVRTIEQLADFDERAPASGQIKTMVFFLDDEPTLVLLRGDHHLQEQKLLDATGSSEARPARPEEMEELLGADAGSLGAVGVKNLPVLADDALRGRRNLVTGANENGFHLRGVDIERDIEVTRWIDAREVGDGEPCPRCGQPLELFKAIEVGHIFKLGRKFAEALGATVLDEQGAQKVVTMGSYGIGLERAMAAVVEASHDDRGIVWPVSVAPFEAVITVLAPREGQTARAGDDIYSSLLAAGIEAMIDDRDERPGVKFADAELIGVPYRITVGPRSLAEGVVELTERSTGETVEYQTEAVVDAVSEKVTTQRL